MRIGRKTPVRHENTSCDMRTHLTHPVHFLRQVVRKGIQVPYDRCLRLATSLRYVGDESQEDAIIIAKSEIACLDNISLEGDIPDDMSQDD